MKMKNLASAIALAATMGATSTASAVVIDMDFDGMFTMITPAGGVLFNPDAAGTVDGFGIRTAVAGTMTFDTDTGAGSGTVGAFLFSGTNAAAHDITMQAIGDGMGGPGTLVMGSMLFDYGPTLDIPVYLVADAAGLFGAFGPGGVNATVGDVISGVGATSASQDAVDGAGFGGYTPNLGNVPFAMTSLDVNQDGDPANTCGSIGGTGALIGGGFPLCDDGVAGVRMATAPFPGHGANFDITSATITAVSAVPVPAAVWLFGSGLVGLAGVARRRKAA